jgi:hypothetical protein
VFAPAPGETLQVKRFNGQRTAPHQKATPIGMPDMDFFVISTPQIRSHLNPDTLADTAYSWQSD